MLKPKFVTGIGTLWGFGIDFDPYYKEFHILFICWFFSIEFRSKNAV